MARVRVIVAVGIAVALRLRGVGVGGEEVMQGRGGVWRPAAGGAAASKTDGCADNRGQEQPPGPESDNERL